MKILNYFFVLAISVALFSCNDNQDLKPAPVSFSGKIIGAENQKLFIRQETINNNFMDTIEVSLNGDFAYDLMLDKPSYFTFFVGRNQVIVYMKPGDSLKFNGDIQMFDEAKFDGSSAIYNDYLAKFAKSQGEFAANMQISFKQEEGEAVKTMDSLRTEQMNQLYDLEKNYSKTDKIFLDMEKSRIKYFWGLNHVMYPLYYSYYNQAEDFKTSASYDSYLGELNINDSNLISLPEYRQFITNYLNSKVNDYFKDENLMSSQPSFTAYQLENIKTLFTDNSIKSYLAYRVMKEHVTYDGIKDYDLIYPLYQELCSTESFKKEIDDELVSWESLKKGQPSKDFSGVNIKGETVKLSDFKGKYVYVDVWATWCNPCMKEVPYLIEVEKALEGKNIVFLGASVDRDKSAWEKMINEGKLAGVQIYVGLSDELSGFYKITGIPRFMLFDKEGNILEVSADRPSSGIERKLLALDGI